MRVLMIAPTPFFADRGCHTRIYEEIKALQKRGHEVKLCTYGLGRDVPGIEIVRTVHLPWYQKLSAGPSKTKILLLPLLLITVLQECHRFKPDVVHAHLHEGACLAKVCRLFYPRAAYVFDMQGSLTKELLQHEFIRQGSVACRCFYRLEKKIDAWHTIIVSADRIKEELKEMGCDTTNCINVKDGVDTKAFFPQAFDKAIACRNGVDIKKRRILYMGLLEKYQGVDIMLEAFRIIYQTYTEVQFLLIGYPNIEKYRSICEEKGICKAVIFLGKTDYFSLPRYLSLADIAVAPNVSKTEGNGTIYNYMAMGMATVAFDTKVSREILGDAGIYAAEGNAGKLAEKLIFCLEHPEFVKRMGKRARERAEQNLSWDNVGKRIEEVYKIECCKKGRK